MTDPHIFITRRIPDPGLALLRDAAVRTTIFQHDEEQGLTREELLTGVRDCSVLLPLLTEPIDREVLEANPGLLGVANMAVGFNNIDTDAATELGIPISNTPGVLTESTADLTWALILGAARRITEAHNYMVEGRYKIWGPNLFLGEDVGTGGDGERKVLGIIGYGRIGIAVARRSIGFDMDVIAFDPYGRQRIDDDDLATWAELPDLLAKSDFVSLHPLLSPETHHLIGEPELKMMKPTAFLINAARGPIVDEKALVKALRNGWIGGAGLDVFEDEPAMQPGLAEHPNTVLLPHIASATRTTRGLMSTIAATNALCHLRRERAPNVVNPEVYDTEAYQARVGR